MFQTVARFLARLAPERHRVVRAHFAGLFTPRRAERYRERIVARVDALLDALPASGPADLVTAFTRPLPFTVIAEVLGVPADRHDWLSAAMDTFGRAVAGQRDRANVERGNAVTAEMLRYFDRALTESAASPGEDVLSLLAAQPSDLQVRADLLANCIFFVLAGHVTTTALLSAGVELLSTHRDQLGRLMASPAGWPAAVEELLAAANRDPGVFDSPDRLDFTRTPNPHLAFSAGAHFCLGAPLAWMHAEIALPALFHHLPGLQLAGPPVWLGSVPIRQIAALPVEWT